MYFFLFIIFTLRCPLLTSCLAMTVDPNSTTTASLMIMEQNYPTTIRLNNDYLTNDTMNNIGGRRSGKKIGKKWKTNVNNHRYALSRDDSRIYKKLSLKHKRKNEKNLKEFTLKQNFDSPLDQATLKNRQRRQFLPGKGLLNILNPLGPRSIAANPGLFGSLGNAGLLGNKLQRNQASNIIDPSQGLLGGLNPFDTGGGLSSGFGLTGGALPTSAIGGGGGAGGQDGVSNFFCSIFRYLLGNLIAG